MNERYLLRFEVGGETYALDMAWVRTTERTDRAGPAVSAHSAAAQDDSPAGPPRPTPVGTLNLDGAEVALYSLSALLGGVESAFLAPPSDTQQRIIVLRSDPGRTRRSADPASPGCGLVIDRLGQPLRIAAERVVPMPPIAAHPQRSVFEGVALLDDQMLLVLEPSRLLYPQKHEPVHPPGGRQAVAEARRPIPIDLRTAGPTGSAAATRQRMVRFTLPQPSAVESRPTFALSLSQVPEVLETLPVLRVPFAPPFVRGLVPWRGRAVPLIDLALRLGWAAAPGDASPEKTRLLIVRSRHPGSSGGGDAADGWCAFSVQADVRITPLSPALPLPAGAVSLASGVALGAFEEKDGHLVVLDVPAILSPPAPALELSAIRSEREA